MKIKIVDCRGNPGFVFEDCPSEGQLVPYVNGITGDYDPLVYFYSAKGGRRVAHESSIKKMALMVAEQ